MILIYDFRIRIEKIFKTCLLQNGTFFYEPESESEFE